MAELKHSKHTCVKKKTIKRQYLLRCVLIWCRLSDVLHNNFELENNGTHAI